MHRSQIVVASLLFAAIAVACSANESNTASAPDTPEPTSTSTSTSTPKQPEVEGVVLRYGDLTERVIDIQADGRNLTAAVAGMNEFAVDLYKATAATNVEPNMVISPYSVTFALSMIYAGADGQTAEEMAAVLHASGLDDWQEGINAFDLSLDARTAGSDTTWRSANKVWTRPWLPLRNQYLDVLTGVYDSPLAEANFATAPDAERLIINKWIEANTNELIPELFPEKSFDGNTAMVLVNAIALDAPWQFPLNPTDPQGFTRADGTNIAVPSMRYDEFLPSGFGEDFVAVELPYSGGALSMIVIQPDDLTEFEANLSAESLDRVIGSIREGGIHLTMPKWASRTHLRLNDTLSALGMPTAFSSSDADFSKMIEGGGLWLDFVEHEAFIEVDEEGTRAAAATGGAMADSHGPTVEINQPFLYLIRDTGAGTILFIGKVTDPTVGP